jgi:transposase
VPEQSAACPRCAELEKVVAPLQEQVRLLQEEVRELRARLNLSSKNSSKPPSSDPPWFPRPPANPTGRKQGGQPGHPGAKRAEFRATEIDHHVAIEPERCEKCKGSLARARVGEPEVVQVVDLPPVAAEVTEYTLGTKCCPGCGHVTAAPLPTGVEGAIGLRFQAVLAVLVGRFRLSRREVQEAALALFGPKARVSLGWISVLEQRTAQALLPAYVEIEAAVRASPVVNADETSWRERRKSAWLWHASTPGLSLYRIDPRRNREAFERLLGEDFKHLLVSDRWSVYRCLSKRMRQICWAHLKRNFQELVDRGGASVEVGQEGLDILREVMLALEAHRENCTALATLSRHLSPLRLRMFNMIQRGVENADVDARKLCRDLEVLFPCLWTFARVKGVPITNNLAERRLRPAVLWRKTSFGTHSSPGSRFAERMMTVVQTLRAQGRSILDFVAAALGAARGGRRLPSALPP